MTQPWFSATDNSHQGKSGIHALFIDFKKAFDLADHEMLLNKLARMNFNKSFWMWTKSFLLGRTQQVKLNGTLSSIKNCPTGVPKCSVLSPTLFSIHIDDLVSTNNMPMIVHKVSAFYKESVATCCRRS